MHEDNKQRVWIELETPVVLGKGQRPRNSDKAENTVGTSEEQKALMETRAKLLSNMLRRLGAMDEDTAKDRIFVYEEKPGYFMYAIRSTDGTFTPWSDSGFWFNLGFLGRED